MLIRLRIILGVALLVGLIWYFELNQVLPQLMTLDFRWLTVTAILIIASVVVGGVNLYLFISQRGDIAIMQFLPLYWVAWAFSLVVPGQIGDVASLPIMLRRYGFSWHTSLGRMVLDKLISFSVIAGLALCGLLPLVTDDTSSFLLVIFLAMLAIVTILWRTHPSWHQWLINSEIRVVRMFFNALREIVAVVRDYPKYVAVNVSLTCVKILLLGLSYWTMFAAFGYDDLPFIHVVLLMSASSIVAYLPISFNGLGTVELAGVFLFAAIGLPEITILSAYLVMRLLVLIIAWTPGSYFLLLLRR